MGKFLLFDIEAPAQGKRLDVFLADTISDFSRESLKTLIKNGEITVNGAMVKAGFKLTAGDRIQVKLPPTEEMQITPQPLPLNIIYEDDILAVVSKPAGQVVHPGAGNMTGTLVNALLHRFPTLSDLGGVFRAGIVHRLDKDTSGGLVIAKTNTAHKKLSRQFSERSAVREYVTLVRGTINANTGEISAPIGRSPANRQKMAVVPSGKEAVTHFEVIKRFNKFTLLKVSLVTGRTHQIRVHMAYIKHPVIGDKVYSSGKNPWQLDFQLLHAFKLGFVHPDTDKYMEFEIPLPDYFQNIIDKEAALENSK